MRWGSAGHAAVVQDPAGAGALAFAVLWVLQSNRHLRWVRPQPRGLEEACHRLQIELTGKCAAVRCWCGFPGVATGRGLMERCLQCHASLCINSVFGCVNSIVNRHVQQHITSNTCTQNLLIHCQQSSLSSKNVDTTSWPPCISAPCGYMVRCNLVLMLYSPDRKSP